MFNWMFVFQNDSMEPNAFISWWMCQHGNPREMTFLVQDSKTTLLCSFPCYWQTLCPQVFFWSCGKRRNNSLVPELYSALADFFIFVKPLRSQSNVCNKKVFWTSNALSAQRPSAAIVHQVILSCYMLGQTKGGVQPGWGVQPRDGSGLGGRSGPERGGVPARRVQPRGGSPRRRHVHDSIRPPWIRRALWINLKHSFRLRKWSLFSQCTSTWSVFKSNKKIATNFFVPQIVWTINPPFSTPQWPVPHLSVEPICLHLFAAWTFLSLFSARNSIAHSTTIAQENVILAHAIPGNADNSPFLTTGKPQVFLMKKILVPILLKENHSCPRQNTIGLLDGFVIGCLLQFNHGHNVLGQSLFNWEEAWTVCHSHVVFHVKICYDNLMTLFVLLWQ